MPSGARAVDRMINDAASYVLEILPKNPEYARRVAKIVAIKTGAIVEIHRPRIAAVIMIAAVAVMTSGWVALAIDLVMYD